MPDEATEVVVTAPPDLDDELTTEAADAYEKPLTYYDAAGLRTVAFPTQTIEARSPDDILEMEKAEIEGTPIESMTPREQSLVVGPVALAEVGPDSSDALSRTTWIYRNRIERGGTRWALRGSTPFRSTDPERNFGWRRWAAGAGYRTIRQQKLGTPELKRVARERKISVAEASRTFKSYSVGKYADSFGYTDKFTKMQPVVEATLAAPPDENPYPGWTSQGSYEDMMTQPGKWADIRAYWQLQQSNPSMPKYVDVVQHGAATTVFANDRAIEDYFRSP